MTLYPKVQRKAQEEIDQVVGNGRLPSFDDREALPYVNALALEATRWHQVAPLGVSHSNADDDIVNGYCIPKGSTIVTNVW